MFDTGEKFDESVSIMENQRINDKYYKLVFESENLAKNAKPGQFMQIQIEPTFDPLLRRPFSYYRVIGSYIEVLYEILGRGTGLLATKSVGTSLKVLGPLGKPFSQVNQNKKKVLIAGGIGVPPLIFYAEKNQVDYVLIGAKSRFEVLPSDELANVQGEILYATNDGSYGKEGYVTLLLKDLLAEYSASDLFIQMCGPKPMMRAVLDMAKTHQIQGEASLDENMACGVGACLGCMVDTKEGLVASCVEGPVFDFARIRSY